MAYTRSDIAQYQYLYERPSAQAYGIGQCQVAGETYISDGVSWSQTVPDVLTEAVSFSGFALNQFKNGMKDAYSLVTGTNRNYANGPNGVGILQYPSSGAGTATVLGVVVNCRPFIIRTTTRVIAVFKCRGNRNIASSIYLTTAANAGAFTNSLSGAETQLSAFVPDKDEDGWTYATCTLVGSSLTTNGTGVAVGASIEYARVYSTLPEGSEAILMGIYVDPAMEPSCSIIFDDATLSQYSEGIKYCLAKGFRGTWAMNTAEIGGAQSATIDDLREAYAAGWDIVNHTHTHFYSNAMDTRYQEIAQAQTVLANEFFTLNGTVGTVTFDSPRQLTWTLASTLLNKRVKIIGLGETGQAQTEIVTTTDKPLCGYKIWTKITSIQAIDAITVNTSIGRTASYDEIYSEVKTAKDVLLGYGFTRASDLYIAPGGNINLLLVRALKALGYKYCRSVEYCLWYPQHAPLPFAIPSTGSGIANGDAATLKTYADNLIARKSTGSIYLHQIVEDSVSSPSSIQARISDFKEVIDYLAGLRDAGSLKFYKLRDQQDFIGGNGY